MHTLRLRRPSGKSAQQQCTAVMPALRKAPGTEVVFKASLDYEYSEPSRTRK